MSDEKKENEPDEENQAFVALKAIGKYSSVILVVISFLITFGTYRADYAELTKRVDTLEALKPEQTNWQLNQLDKRVTELELEQKSERDAVYEIKIKIDVIAEWVADQKVKGANGFK